MELTNDIVRVLVKEYVGIDIGDDEIQHLRPMIEQQLQRSRELHDLDLGADDPRSMHYINDRGLLP